MPAAEDSVVAVDIAEVVVDCCYVAGTVDCL